MALTFLKTGAASAQVAAQHQAAVQAAKEGQGKLFRFFLKEGEEARITFVDGELSPEGFLLPPRYYEHSLYLNGSWNNQFVCPEKTNPDSHDKCPICESGDRPALVALFTIIDHRTFTSRDKTKTYTNTRKILVAKPQTFELLNKLASKRGGLIGCTFDVSRVGDKTPAVGSMFDFVEKNDPETLKQKYTVTVTDPKDNSKKVVTNFAVADYEKEIIYRTGEELIKLGLGKPGQGGPAPQTPTGPSQPVDYTDNL